MAHSTADDKTNLGICPSYFRVRYFTYPIAQYHSDCGLLLLMVFVQPEKQHYVALALEEMRHKPLTLTLMSALVLLRAAYGPHLHWRMFSSNIAKKTRQ